MELKANQWYYNPPSDQFNEAWTYVRLFEKAKDELTTSVVEWDTYIMKDGMYLAISEEVIPIELAVDPKSKIRKATNSDLRLLITRIFNYNIEIDEQL